MRRIKVYTDRRTEFELADTASGKQRRREEKTERGGGGRETTEERRGRKSGGNSTTGNFTDRGGSDRKKTKS